MQTTLCNVAMNLMTHLLFGINKFTTKFSKNECAQFKDLIMTKVAPASASNISDFVPFLKSFDIQGLQHQMNQTRLKVENFLYKIIQNHLKENKLDDSKDLIFCSLHLDRENGSNHRLEDNIVKVVINVSYSIFSQFV
jgi:hypothetical protein